MERDQNTGRFRPSPSRRSEPRTWQQPQANADCTSTGSISAVAGILAGAGIGAAAMYLLDPDKGPNRRHALADAAESALATTTDAVSHTWDHLGEKAMETGASLAGSLPSRRDMRKTGNRLLGHAGHAYSDARDTASGWFESAKSYLPNRPALHSSHSRYDVSPTQAGLGAIGALALGMGAMWLFDPARGRSRRAWLGQKATRILNETGSMARATGRHLTNKSKGLYHDASSMVSSAAADMSDSGIAERVRSALGRVGIGKSTAAVRCENGCVTLTGRCFADDVDTILITTRGVVGVSNVMNDMEVTTRNVGAPTAL